MQIKKKLDFKIKRVDKMSSGLTCTNHYESRVETPCSCMSHLNSSTPPTPVDGTLFITQAQVCCTMFPPGNKVNAYVPWLPTHVLKNSLQKPNCTHANDFETVFAVKWLANRKHQTVLANFNRAFHVFSKHNTQFKCSYGLNKNCSRIYLASWLT